MQLTITFVTVLFSILINVSKSSHGSDHDFNKTWPSGKRQEKKKTAYQLFPFFVL